MSYFKDPNVLRVWNDTKEMILICLIALVGTVVLAFVMEHIFDFRFRPIGKGLILVVAFALSALGLVGLVLYNIATAFLYFIKKRNLGIQRIAIILVPLFFLFSLWFLWERYSEFSDLILSLIKAAFGTVVLSFLFLWILHIYDWIRDGFDQS